VRAARLRALSCPSTFARAVPIRRRDAARTSPARCGLPSGSGRVVMVKAEVVLPPRQSRTAAL